MNGADPILTAAQAKELEASLLKGEEAREWDAMVRAGRAVAEAVAEDFQEIGGFPAAGRVLVLAGKGHNGGDALIAAGCLLQRFPAARADVLFAFGNRALRPLAMRAWRELVQAARGRADEVTGPGPSYDLCLDGVFGFQFHPPMPEAAERLLAAVNELPVRLRAAVDLPSGLADGSGPGRGTFRADFTYATGSVKRSTVEESNAGVVGRLRYLDLGFFRAFRGSSDLSILTLRALDPLRGLRSPASDKRTFGHLVLVGGSRSFPGAILMATLAALRSGAGFVTAAVPRSLAPAFAARAPEAIWAGLPEAEGGGIGREALGPLRELLRRGTALALGPGLGRDAETLELIRRLVEDSQLPLVIDADGLQPDIVRAGRAARVLTPHQGEWKRISQGGGDLGDAVVVRKGRLTAVAPGGKDRFLSPFGGPVLARGGSGDLLTGLIGGQLAQAPADPLGAACRGLVWHGRAADLLARAEGQAAVPVTGLLQYLPQVLREG